VATADLHRSLPVIRSQVELREEAVTGLILPFTISGLRGIGVSGVWRSLIDKRVRETQATRYPDRQMLRPHGRR
jgi:hypothetical protein